MSKNINIILVSALYLPEPHVSAHMSSNLAYYLAEQGHCVTVLCPQPSRPLGADYSKHKYALKQDITSENKVNVVKLSSFTAPESHLILRIQESYSFGRAVVKYLTALKDLPDILYINSWPLLSQTIIARFAKANKIPMVLQVMDIYPESLTSKLPFLFRSLVHRPLKLLDTWIAETAAVIVVISENMRRTYTESRRIPSDRVITIPTWQNDSLFEHGHDRISACKHYNIPADYFTFLFLGNIGPVAGIEFLIHAFQKASIDDSQLVIIGDGSSKADCIKLVEQLNASNIHFISDPDAANVPLLQSMAHVCMLPMKKGSGLSSIPSKLPAYLFSTKPVLATVDSESDTARLIQEAECGWVGAPEDLDWLSDKLRNISTTSPITLNTLGQNGRIFGLKYFSKSKCIAQLAQVIVSASLDELK